MRLWRMRHRPHKQVIIASVCCVNFSASLSLSFSNPFWPSFLWTGPDYGSPWVIFYFWLNKNAWMRLLLLLLLFSWWQTIRQWLDPSIFEIQKWKKRKRKNEIYKNHNSHSEFTSFSLSVQLTGWWALETLNNNKFICSSRLFLLFLLSFHLLSSSFSLVLALRICHDGLWTGLRYRN